MSESLLAFDAALALLQKISRSCLLACSSTLVEKTLIVILQYLLEQHLIISTFIVIFFLNGIGSGPFTTG